MYNYEVAEAIPNESFDVAAYLGSWLQVRLRTKQRTVKTKLFVLNLNLWLYRPMYLEITARANNSVATASLRIIQVSYKAF